MACTFVNLHLHTETGSPLDGFSSSEDIIGKSVELGYDSIAVTDHGSMSGILELYKEGKKKGIRVIPGIESYCVDDRTKPHVKGVPNFHLVLLAKNKEGYQNLLKLNFEAYKTGSAKSYMRTIPRVDLDLLKQYGKGVIASSACLIGQIPYLLREGREKEADELADIYKSIFDDFYLEVQPSFLIGEDQKKGNNLIKEMSIRTGIPMIVTLDSHYARPEDRMYHQILLAIQSKKTIYDPDRLNFEATPLISEEEILKEFPKELVHNTRAIAEQCDEAKYLDSGEGYKIPKFPVPTDNKEFEIWKSTRSDKQKDKTESQKYCRYKIELGWKEKLSRVVATEEKLEYKARLDEELKVIEDMGFSDYFLIVADMLEECKKRGISRGAGRGCFIPGTLVTLENGIRKKIEDINIGDFVLTHKGRSRRVLDKMKYEVNEDLLKITTSRDIEEIECTKDHKFFVLRDSQKQWVVAQDLDITDRLLFPKPSSVSRISKIDLFELLKNDCPKLECNQTHVWIKAYGTGNPDRIGTKEIARLADSDLVYVRKVLRKNLKETEKQRYIHKVAEANGYKKPEFTLIPRFIELTSDFARLCGYYVAEGWCHATHNSMCLAFHRKEEVYKKDVEDIVRRLFGLEVKVYTKSKFNAITLSVHSKIVGLLMKEIAGALAGQKRIHDLIMQEERLDIVKEFLIGAINGDGSTTYRDRIIYSTTSETLAYQMKILFSKVGLFGSMVRLKRKEANWNVEYRLLFDGLQLEEFIGTYDNITFKNKDLMKPLAETRDKEHFYHELKGKTISNYKGAVWDLEVEEDSSFIASHVAVHNSAGGSLLAFLMDITKVDPVKYDLLFSRFLNKDRISMPDIDSDICQSRRDEIKQYLVEKYGANKVAGIATFGTMKVRAAIKDIVRSLDLGKGKSDSFKLADQISKCIPDEAPPDISFEDAYKLYPEFKSQCDTQSWQGITLGKLLQRFEGVTRQMGIHAAGVIISTESLAETLPLIIQNDIVATAYDGPTLEKAGYLKLDVLGLRTLDVIDDTVKNISLAYGKELKGFPLGSLDFDPKDPQGEQKFSTLFKAETNEAKKQAARAYRLYRMGQTSACFQVSGSGMQNLLRKVKPNSIEDVAAVLALFRPGPLGSGMTESYAMRKTGKEAVVYDHPDLKPVLESTYNVVTYQEQVMRMAMVIAGFTQSQADTLRKAVGKKIKKLMDEQESKFLEGGLARGYTEELVKKLWQLIVKFAEYGFNKTLSIDTLVLTKEGQKRIADVKIGEIVYSYDRNREIIETRVCIIHDHGVQPCFEVEFENGAIEECSLGHKFLTEFGMQPLYVIFICKLGVKDAQSQTRRVSMSRLSEEDSRIQSVSNAQITMSAGQRSSKEESSTSKNKESKAISLSSVWGSNRESHVTLGASPELFGTSRTSKNDKSRGWNAYSDRGSQRKSVRNKKKQNLRFNTSSSPSTTRQYGSKESECGGKNKIFDYCNKDLGTKGYSIRESQSTFQMERTESRKDERDYSESSSSAQKIKDRSRNRYTNLPFGIPTECSYRLWRQNFQTSRLYEFREENIGRGRWSMAFFASKRGSIFSTSQGQRSIARELGYKESVVFDPNIDGLFLQEQVERRKNAGISRSTEQSRGEDNSYRRVVSFKLKRCIQTLDLEVEHPEHNFILASGLVTSNSHSVAYALTSYKQTFLKANYLAAFWAAALTHEPDEDKRNAYLTEIRQTLRKPKEQQIHVLAVDINESGLEYKCVSPNAIRRNLLSLKGVGEAAVEEIIKNRPYKSFQDFVMKIDSKKINTRVLKVLISAGSFDLLSQDKFTRKYLSYTVENLKAAVTKYKKKHSNLDGFTFDWDKAHTSAINDAIKENSQFEYGLPEWDAAQIRQDEEEIYGVAVSSHLFDDYPGMEVQIQRDYVSRYITLDVDFERYEDRTPVVFVGILKTERKIDCKNGSVLRSYKVEDRYGSAELAVFENEYKLNPTLFKIGNIIIGQATISRKYGSGKKLTLSGGRGRSGVIRVISKI